MAIDGFLTRSVRDTAVMLDACAGRRPWRALCRPALGPWPRRRRSAARRAACGSGSATPPSPAMPSTPRWPRPCGPAGRLLESLGHHVEPARPKADVPMMMRAWTDIVGGRHRAVHAPVAEGPPSARRSGRGRRAGGLGPCRDAAPDPLSEAVGEIHPPLAARWRGSLTKARGHPVVGHAGRAAGAQVGRFRHDRGLCRLSHRARGHLCLFPFCASSTLRASPPPACPWLVWAGRFAHRGASGRGLSDADEDR
jgi:amidase